MDNRARGFYDDDVPWFVLSALLSTGPTVPPDVQARARDLTSRSIREYNLGKFDLALADAENAYELSGLPALLFNLGQCHRAMGHWGKAEFFYRGYLRENPRARNRAAVAQLAEEMHAKASAPPVAAPSALPSPPAEKRRSNAAATRAEDVPPLPRLRGTAEVREPLAASRAAPAAALSEAPVEGHHLRAGSWWLAGGGAVALAAGTVLGALAAPANAATAGPGGVVEHRVPAGSYVAGQYEGGSADVLWTVGAGLVVAALVVALTGS